MDIFLISLRNGAKCWIFFLKEGQKPIFSLFCVVWVNKRGFFFFLNSTFSIIQNPSSNSTLRSFHGSIPNQNCTLISPLPIIISNIAITLVLVTFTQRKNWEFSLGVWGLRLGLSSLILDMYQKHRIEFFYYYLHGEFLKLFEI